MAILRAQGLIGAARAGAGTSARAPLNLLLSRPAAGMFRFIIPKRPLFELTKRAFRSSSISFRTLES